MCVRLGMCLHCLCFYQLLPSESVVCDLPLFNVEGGKHTSTWYMKGGLCFTVNLHFMLLKVLQSTAWSNNLFCTSKCFMLPPQGTHNITIKSGTQRVKLECKILHLNLWQFLVFQFMGSKYLNVPWLKSKVPFKYATSSKMSCNIMVCISQT